MAGREKSDLSDYAYKALPAPRIPIIGCLGDIIFSVSSAMVQTLHDAKWSGSVRVSEHQRHNYHALTEFTGIDPDKFSFEMTLAAYLGSDPMAEMVKIWTYEREFRPVPLIIGDKIYGKYRWTVQSHDNAFEHYDGNGNVIAVTVSVNLLEYVER